MLQTGDHITQKIFIITSTWSVAHIAMDHEAYLALENYPDYDGSRSSGSPALSMEIEPISPLLDICYSVI
jgi:hypothetical protein